MFVGHMLIVRTKQNRHEICRHISCSNVFCDVQTDNGCSLHATLGIMSNTVNGIYFTWNSEAAIIRF